MINEVGSQTIGFTISLLCLLFFRPLGTGIGRGIKQGVSRMATQGSQSGLWCSRFPQISLEVNTVFKFVFLPLREAHLLSLVVGTKLVDFLI